MPAIEINNQFSKALEAMEKTDHNVFLTGRAGTGKSTLLEYFKEHTKKNIVVLAPTGVGALNVHGQTVHSFFGFKPDITPKKARELGYAARSDGNKRAKLYKELKTAVIDEISMVRADLLDCMDEFLRAARKKKDLPFGGVQMIMIGDLYQLPPVVTSAEKYSFAQQYPTSYFFSANALKNFPMDYIELEKIYRQSDAAFIRILNAIRNNTVDENLLAELNQQVRANFNPHKDNKLHITLTPTNAAAHTINQARLRELKGEPWQYRGHISGTFEEKQVPTDYDLYVKPGAQVMMVANDREGRWVNGSVGKIVKRSATHGEPDTLWVEFSKGRKEKVEPYTWEMFSYRYDPDTRQVETETVGSFTQYPLKLAWAVTIHKAQGKTFDRVVIDMGRGAFTHGQTYVALSRSRTLEGIVLTKPIAKRHIWVDWRVRSFVTKYQYAVSAAQMPTEEKVRVIEQAIRDKASLRIVYLKNEDVKSKRVIRPAAVGEMEYKGYSYLGLEAFCEERQGMRTFRVEKILEMQKI